MYGKQVNHESPITLEEDENYDNFITGQRNNKEVFQIHLDYQTIRLNQAEFCDLTGDSRMEMCIGLDIANTAASDINAIHVYDSVSLKLLFPNESKSPVYNGKIVRLEEDGLLEYAIEYTSFAKVGGIAFPDEESLIGWRDDRFTVLKYQKKLVAIEEETAVFLKDYSCYEKALTLKLSVEKIGDHEQNRNQVQEINQDITIELEEDADLALLDKKIEGNDLVILSDIDDDGEFEIVIRPYAEDPNKLKEIIYDWNSKRGYSQMSCEQN